MNTIYEGKAFVFGDNLDTDQIYPGQYLELARPEEIKKHALEGADPGFMAAFTPGDLIVAGTNFGCGSSREHAAIALKAVGARVILAESFARIFYRNAINLGLAVLVSPGLRQIVSAGDRLRVDLENGHVQNLTTGKIAQVEPLSGYSLTIVTSGGIIPLVKAQLKATDVEVDQCSK